LKLRDLAAEKAVRKEETSTITEEEFNRALEIVRTFRCPNDRTPILGYCPGYDCPSPWEEWEDRCLEVGKARTLLQDVFKGKVRVVKPRRGWEVPL